MLVPTEPSSLKISDLDAEDMYTLNALHRVEFDREKHGKYALSELITEIGHFLDPNTVRKIE